MGPLEMLYSWQALLVAVACTGITQLVKVSVDVARGSAEIKKTRETTPPAETAALKPMAIGKDLRKENAIFNRIVFPTIPIIVGAVFAVLVPARPEVIVEYVAEHAEGWTGYLVYAAWGAACGQFADYLFSKAKGAMSDLGGSK